MKKLLTLFLASLLVLSLAACGGEAGNTDDTSNSDTDPVVDTTPTEDTTDPVEENKNETYLLVFESGIALEIGGEAEYVINSLPDPIDCIEAPSCIREGTDKVYTYDGYTITTSPGADGVQYVSEVSITSDEVALQSGLTIGSTVADMEAALGTDYVEVFGVYRYTVDGAIIGVLVNDDAVASIAVASTKE